MKIALVGNQNSGKTSLFNVLTGTNQTVGNWPGVTIEHKEGIIKGTHHRIIDLPGIYSLSPYTAEEEISRRFAMEENPDLIINIVDATSLERSLYLTTQLMELNTKMIVALNMSDLLEKKGLNVNEKKLEELLGVKVVKVSAYKNTGIDELIKLIESKDLTISKKVIYDETLQNAVNRVAQSLDCEHSRFVAVKLLERDKSFEKYIKDSTIVEDAIKEIESYYDSDAEQIIANERYDYITKNKNLFLTKKTNKQTITDKIDKIILNKWLALPIFACIMGLIYFLSVGLVGSATVDFIDGVVVSGLKDWLGEVLTNWGTSDWVVSLVCDGIIAGAGAMLNFVPQLMILFICIAILETSGYMSRIAFFFDKIFKKFGLSGKSLIPFIVGSGCSVPGIMTTRTIEDENEKKATIMLTPFIPCSAKLPIITCFAGYFFGKGSWLVMLSLYLMAILVILISSILLRKFIYKGNSNTFISELPEYKIPSIKYVAKDTLDKTLAFIKRAGTIILLCSVVIWLLLSFNWKFEYLGGENIDSSILASIGNCFAWVFYPMLGEWSWAATVSAVQGLVAKEQVVSSMSIIAGLGEEGEAAAILSSSIFGFFKPASAYAYMVFNLFSAPCFGAIGAMHREFGDGKKTLIAVAFQTGMAWILAVLVFGIGSLISLIV